MADPRSAPHAYPENQLQIGEARKNNFFENLRDSFLLDTAAGQLYDRHTLLYLRNLDGVDEVDPNYNVWDDPMLAGNMDGLSLDVLRDLGNVTSRSEAHMLLAMYRRNMGRRDRLEHSGASFSRFMAGFADPANLIPVPLAIGKGIMGAVKSTFMPNAAIITGSELIRHSVDPTSTGSETLMNIGAGTLMATAITGGVGFATSRGRNPRWYERNERFDSRRSDNAFNEDNMVSGNIDMVGGNTLAQWEMTRQRFKAEVAPHMPEGTTYNQFMRGTMQDPWQGLKFQGMRWSRDGFGSRIMIRPVGTTFELVVQKTNGEWERQAVGTQRELVQGLSPLTTRQVDNFYSRDAIDVGTMKVDDVYPDFEKNMEGYDKQFLTDSYAPSGARIARQTETEIRASRMAEMDQLGYDYGLKHKNAKIATRNLLNNLSKLEREKRYRNQYSRPKEVVDNDIELIKRWLNEAVADEKMYNEKLGQNRILAERMRKTNSPRGNDIAATGTGLASFMAKSKQWPWYTLMENKLRTLVDDGGALGLHVQQIAQRLSASPGIYTNQQLAGDVGTGTSVEMRAMTHIGHMKLVKSRIDGIYANYAGYTQDTGRVNAGQQLYYRIKNKFSRKEGIVSIDEFQRLITHSMAHGGNLPLKPPYNQIDDATRQAVEQASQEARKFYNMYKDEGNKLGIFSSQRSLQQEIDYLDARIEKARTNEKKAELRIYRDSIQQRLDQFMDGDAGDGPGGTDYFPAMWNPDTFTDPQAEARLRKQLRKDFLSRPYIYQYGKKVMLSTEPEAVAKRVDRAVMTLRRQSKVNDTDYEIEIGDARDRYVERVEELKTQLADTENLTPERQLEIEQLIADYENAIKLNKYPRVGMPSPFLQRRFNFKNGYRDYMEFMVDDHEFLMMGYTTKMSKRMEMVREFGDASLAHEVDALTDWGASAIRSARAKGDAKRADAIEKELENVIEAIAIQRDRVYKTFGMRTDPDAISGRAVDMGLVLGATLHMGKSFQAQMLDLGNAIAFTGFRRFFGAGLDNFMSAFDKEANRWNIAKEEVELAGRVQEVLMATRYHELTNTGGVFYNGSRTERAIHNFGGRFFVNNLMGPMTDFMYRFLGVMANDRILIVSRKIAGGEQLTDKEARDVARAGLTEEAAKRIYRQWRKVPKDERNGNDINLPGTNYWDDPVALREFRAISNDVVSSFIPTPGSVDKPNFMLSEDWAKIMMQYKAFPLMATQKIMMANLQRNDKMALASVASLVFGGWMLDRVRRPDYIDLPLGDQLYRSIELSGVTGIFSDINSMLEGATANEYGIRPMLGLKPFDRDPNWASRVGAVAGPLPNTFATAIHAFTSPDAGADDRARAVRYLIPYNNHFAFAGLFTSGQRTVAESGIFGEQ